MPFPTGKMGDISSSTIPAISAGRASGATTVLRRVICVKSPPFHLQRHGLAANAIGLAITPDHVDQWLQARAGCLEVMDILPERILGASWLSDPIRLHLTLVNAAGDPVEVWSRLAELLLQEGEIVAPSSVGDGKRMPETCLARSPGSVLRGAETGRPQQSNR